MDTNNQTNNQEQDPTAKEVNYHEMFPNGNEDMEKNNEQNENK